jgi:tetratricopeptide (TPR) repeat protein
VGRRSIQIIAALLFAALTAVSFSKLPMPIRGARGDLFVPRPEVARVASLGFEALVADYYWLQAVQIVGGAENPVRYAPLIGRLIDVVTSLNPWVGHPYRFAAIWMIDSPESVRHANQLLERAIRHHPDDWRQYFYLGFNHFFYLEDNEAAAAVLERAIALRGAPLYLKRLVARLKAQADGLETGATFLRELIQTTRSKKARAKYERALDEIETERRARGLDRAREEYRERFGRDIESIEDLVRGPDPVREKLPPEPHGWEWILKGKKRRLVSSYYGHRYEPQFHRAEKKRRRRWKAEHPEPSGSGR